MAIIKTLDQAKKVIASQRAQINELTAALEAANTRRAGLRSDVVDKYTPMQAAELRGLVIKRGGNPDEITDGFHSRQRSIKLREWLREHPPKKTKEVPAPAKAPAGKKTSKVVEAPPEKKPRRRTLG